MIGFYILIGAIALVSWLVSSQLKRKFAHYSKVQLRNGMSGAEIAEKMLADHGISDVKVVSTAGRLTDHYNPKDKTVNLSEAVYSERNAAAAAVAAHECGHAVQHAPGRTNKSPCCLSPVLALLYFFVHPPRIRRATQHGRPSLSSPAAAAAGIGWLTSNS